jgi:hypothetical protein
MLIGGDTPHLLDRFSQADLRTWQRMADKADRYWIGLYHYLEAQRQLNHSDLLEALQSATPTAIRNNIWFRIVDYQFSMQPLSLVGSMRAGGRFNIGQDLDPSKFPVFPALYAGVDYPTSYAEKFGRPSNDSGEFSGHEFALRPPGSFSAVRLRINATNLFDLRTLKTLRAFVAVIRRFKMPAELKALAQKLEIRAPWLIQDPKPLREALLASNWRSFPVQFGIPANPQVFGRLLVEAGFQGIVYPSSKTSGECAAIFPQNFPDVDSFVELQDDAPAELSHKLLNVKTLAQFGLP